MSEREGREESAVLEVLDEDTFHGLHVVEIVPAVISADLDEVILAWIVKIHYFNQAVKHLMMKK